MTHQGSLTIIAVAICCIFSYLFGIISWRYNIFPLSRLRALFKHFKDAKDAPAYYQIKTSFFDLKSQTDHDIVFIGDSITDFSEWNELFPNSKIANRGISGDTTNGILNRMDSIYSTGAKKAFIMVGLNDFNSGFTELAVLRNYKSIVEKLVENGMNVFIQSTLLTANNLGNVNRKITELNKSLYSYSKTNNKLTFIDLNSTLSQSNTLNSKLTVDSIHLNGLGYAKWKEIIAPYIEKVN
ncbi:GDSL-type esterase/lipase family protein [Puniceicoccaceae bacterium K14]|nr:GDSL-type esterase/lipase family protein [Puniceicoccaceae bacterium K14]